jgi:hypothetical protein
MEMDGASDEAWKVKRDSVDQLFEKLQEDLKRMDKFNA